ncbi:MAG: hypothetical protein Kow0047_18320 [Anaerolineae bacterium]
MCWERLGCQGLVPGRRVVSYLIGESHARGGAIRALTPRRDALVSPWEYMYYTAQNGKVHI